IDDIRNSVKRTSPEAVESLEQIKEALKNVTDPRSGVTVVPKRGLFYSQPDLGIMHEELFHAEVQHAPGKGILARAVPAEMINDPGIAKMKSRVSYEVGESLAREHPEVVIAEAVVDLVDGTPHELSPEEAEKTATKYYEAVAEMHGPQVLEKAQA